MFSQLMAFSNSKLLHVHNQTDLFSEIQWQLVRMCFKSLLSVFLRVAEAEADANSFQNRNVFRPACSLWNLINHLQILACSPLTIVQLLDDVIARAWHTLSGLYTSAGISWRAQIRRRNRENTDCSVFFRLVSNLTFAELPSLSTLKVQQHSSISSRIYATKFQTDKF